jgi:hypothetical protein
MIKIMADKANESIPVVARLAGTEYEMTEKRARITVSPLQFSCSNAKVGARNPGSGYTEEQKKRFCIPASTLFGIIAFNSAT